MPGRCVYTAILGGYERLNEQPAAVQSGIPFICLTDDPHLRSETWQVRLVKPAFDCDPVRSQRDFKIRPHVHLPEFSHSLYIDNSVILKVTPEPVFELAAASPEGLLMVPHSFRKTVLDEFLEVARLGFDDSNRIFEQLNHYLLNHAEVLDERPWWGGMAVRDHGNPRSCRAFDLWALHVMRYSRRDQLSVNVALRLAGIEPMPLEIDNQASQFHSWPHAQDRERQLGERNVVFNMTPLAGRLRLAERQLETSGDELSRLRAENEKLKARLAELSMRQGSVLRRASRRFAEPLRRLFRRAPALPS